MCVEATFSLFGTVPYSIVHVRKANPTFTSEKGPLRKRGAARRAAILTAATELFLSQSYERTSLDQIVERAGGSRTLVYEQFGDKEGLFKAVMQELCESIFRPVGLDEITSDTKSKHPEKVLTRLAQSFLQTIWGDEVVALSRIMYTEGPRHPEISDVFFVQGYDEGFRRLAQYIASLLREPLRPGVGLQLAMTFFCMLKGDAYDRRLAGSNQQRTAAEMRLQVRTAVRWLLQEIGLDQRNSS